MAVVEAISKAEAAAEAAGSRPKIEPPHTSTTDTILDERQRDDETSDTIRLLRRQIFDS